MLRLKNIVKDYEMSNDLTVHALKDVSIDFRPNELVSILGPSGCGKTTMLNIIGGLDKYTSGDLMINGRTTKEYKDSDWDVYRNHRVGFIFQSYNLIPHQTILGNVELALTIAGMSKAERQEKAKKALDRVGLAGQYNKRPNQLSGGQCQRVAIARALVNDPEILLADEPTGALDTTTSVQIMDLVKEIASDRLVIMVTHNPELAEQYSTRIIRFLDGELLADSNPYDAETETTLPAFGTPRANNYMAVDTETVEERVEVALQSAEIKYNKNSPAGKRQKVKQIEEPQEASNTVEMSNGDDGGNGGKKKKKKKRHERAKMSFFTAFKLSLQNLGSKKSRTVLTSVAGSIGIIGVSLVLAISFGVSSFIVDMQKDMLSAYPITVTKTAMDLNAMMSGNMYQTAKDAVKVEDGYVNVDYMIDYLVKNSEGLEGLTLSNKITKEYVDYLRNMPESQTAPSVVHFDYNLDITNNIYTDFTDYNNLSGAIGTRNMSITAIKELFTAVLLETDYAKYADMIGSLGNSFSQLMDNKEYVETQYDVLSGEIATEKDEIMIVVNRNTQLTDLTLAQLGYFTQDEFIDIILKSVAEDTDPDERDFSYEELMGKKFTWYPNDTAFTTHDNISIPGFPVKYPYPYMVHNYMSDDFSDEGAIELKVTGILQAKDEINFGSLSSGFYYTTALAEHMVENSLESKTALHMDKIVDFMNANSETEYDLGGSIPNLVPEVIEFQGMVIQLPPFVGFDFDYFWTEDGKVGEVKDTLGLVGNSNALLSFFPGFANTKFISKQGFGGIPEPNSISFYASDFEQNDIMRAYLDEWNSDNTITYVDRDGKTVELTANKRDEVTYTDTLSIVFTMVNSLINIITYALIGFTSLSLIVSCVMIAIITYVSVFERTKEIGIIRSLGGRKRDVSNLFNAETFILGALSGIIGIAITYLVTLIVNLALAAQNIVIARFPIPTALIMLGISILLTVISGFIPARSAAKKDPVVALRTE